MSPGPNRPNEQHEKAPGMKRFFLGLGVGLMLALGSLGASLVVLVYTPVSAAGTTVKPVLLIDHERIAVWKLVLEPGQSTKQHTHQFDEVVICLEGSKLRATQAGPEPERQTHYPEAGQVIMPPVKGVTHTLTNVGDTRYSQISIELKE